MALDDIKTDPKERIELDKSEIQLLPVKDNVMFPGLVIPLVISETEYTQMLDDAIMRGHLIGIVCRRESPTGNKDAVSYFDFGVTAQVLKMLRFPDGSVRILIKGQDRFKIKRTISSEPPPLAEIEILSTQYLSEVKEEALIRTLKELLQKLTEKVNYLPEDLLQTASHAENASSLIDIIASNLKLDTGAKQLILETSDVMKRLRLIVSHIRKEIEIVDIAAKIKDDAAAEINKSQREFILREQMKAIQRELGETDDRNAEIEEYRRKMEEAGLTDSAKEAAEQELERFARMNAAAAEYSVSRNYLDWLVSLPWKKGTEDNLDIPESQRILDEDHYGLEKIKERILEYLAVRKLNPNIKGPILCFVGPPGVGKTSLGKSIARAMNRKFYRMSLGGVRDEAEIRGHRRTYVGSMPGRLIQALRKVKSNNPVIMLDELDKLGNDFRGDPASALLEVLDPEQNWSFSDHYLEVPFDLSKAFFIGTANLLEPVPPALKDRMEVVYLSGYTDIEKLAIAKSYLIPQELQNHGLTSDNIRLSDKAVMKLMDDYTREAGLRNLKREIGSICRKVARVVAEGKNETVNITPQKVRKYLGPERFMREILLDKSRIGIVPGLAWTSVGGDVLYIEATKMPGNKHLTLTGQIGNVMKESMQAALSYIRSKSPVWDIDPEMFEVFDFHIHVPAGATPKDGPSAGITIATALLSILTERPVKPQLAMTGEITLRGDVLPIGGLKEKSLAAYRLGIKTILFPQSNEKDLDEVPKEIRNRINFIPLSCVDDVFEHALDKEA